MPTIPLMSLVCCAVLLVGCNREGNAPDPTATPSTAPPSPRGPLSVTNVPAPTTVIPDSGNTTATLQRLTQALRDHVVGTRSVPKDFEEFAAKSQVSFPPPPEGKKYAIRGQEVVLVNR
ncbi:MAG: hypothetical protein KJ070_20235 [Verrucomicrobia bacterium]|nr:hypothetical protein [Verrucomicrobiota bacterium]